MFTLLHAALVAASFQAPDPPLPSRLADQEEPLRLERPKPADSGEFSPILTLDAEGWREQPSGWIFITRGSEPGSATRARIGRELDVEGRPVGAFEVLLHLGDVHAIGVRGMDLNVSGEGVASEGFIYHGRPYDAGRLIRTSLDIRIAELDYEITWRLSERLQLTGLAGVEYWDFTSRLRTVDGGAPIDERRAFSSGFWLAGAALRWEFVDGLALRVSIRGGIESTSRHAFDAEAGIEWRLMRNMSVTLGYRVHELRFHQSTNEADLLYAGPVAGLLIRF